MCCCHIRRTKGADKLNKCKRYTVTAIGVSSEKIVTATNGNGNGNECSGEVGNCGCTHAEINLLKVMPNPQKVWVSHAPCIECAKALADSGIKIVEYESEYRIPDGVNYLIKTGILVEQT